jgi:capsular exopolysaccharide synthesis family protein
MASKGTVKDALDKARARRLAVLKAHGRRTGDLSTGAAATPGRQATAMDRQTAIVERAPSFRFVPYDSSLAQYNRVLMSDAQAASKTTGAAAYRMLRARLLQRARANSWTAIGVTSPGAGEGKSLTSINLALTIAREKNNNVFLIDLDMRNPKMCQYIGASPPTEINDFLAGDAQAQDCLFSIGIDNLTLAGTRTATDESSELLASGRVEELFQFIRNVAPEPLIIVDLPPLLSTDDALVVAPKVDACVLVVCEGKSRRDGAAKALELLSEFNLAGIVLNQSHTVVSDYYSS